MTGRSIQRPDVAAVMARLKDFQRETVDHVFDRLFLDPSSSHRFLVADEVGLGKTMVARGVIARAIDRLWDTVGRIDVVYICSNAEIARQNVNRLNVIGEEGVTLASRLTMLPTELSGLRQNKVNFVSFTPGTSFDLRSGVGQARERVLLYHMLREEWGFRNAAAPRNVLQGYASSDSFRWQIDSFDEDIEPDIKRAFHEALAIDGARGREKGLPNLRERFDRLCVAFARSDARVSAEERAERNRFVGDLRRILAETCIRALEPDLVILDEFQRFKSLLGGEDDAALLARELFNYGDAESKVRVLLLSATPYKMFTATDEAGGEDHYSDFVDTLRFLQHDGAETERTALLLGELRRQLLRGGPESGRELDRIRGELESRLRRVMVRTERLAASPDRNGMLREVIATNVGLKSSDARVYCAVQSIGEKLDHADTIEYWKAAPYLLNFMEDYELKKRLERSLGREGDGAVAVDMRTAVRSGVPLLLSRDAVEQQAPIDPPHARMRWLLDDVMERGTWQLLWLPPSLPYYRGEGPFARPELSSFTKRLVFSAWKVVPKTIATLVSYEAERRMLAATRRDGERRSEQIERTKALLKFTRSDGRLTGMPVLALAYPSIALARLGDPLHHDLSGRVRVGLPTYVDIREEVKRRLAEPLAEITAGASTTGPADESWYWAAPLLLDLRESPASARAWLSRPDLAARWEGEPDDEPDEHSGWRDHVQRAVDLLAPDVASTFGPPPGDLAEVLADLAISGPAVCALRALSRMDRAAECMCDHAIRDAAGAIAHGFRSLFNLPEVISLLRGLLPEEAYWRSVLTYGSWGGLQAVLDEYAHVLREFEGLFDKPPAVAATEMARRMREALGVRTSRLGVDDIRIAGNGRVVVEPTTMRARFAMRFGDERKEDGDERTRADVVRTAFNSPFWPFVLASTSVGQEGLDFHLYCHAVVHWNLPSNPVDMEQREGRVHRFKGHAVRKNVALRHGRELESEGSEDPWTALFDLARYWRPPGSTDLVPYWVYPHGRGATIERHVPHIPLSRDSARYSALRRSMAMYRMVFGQPRQDELLEYLASRSDEDNQHVVNSLRIDLAPSASSIGGDAG